MKPIPFICPACEKKTEMKNGTALVHVHPSAPEYDFVQVKCECGKLWSVFKLEPLFMQLYALGVRYVVHKDVDPGVVTAYLYLYQADNDLLVYFHRILMDIGGPDEIRWTEHS